MAEQRLIDAEALIKEANAEGAYGYVDVAQIANAPTIEAKPVVHAHWEYHGGDDAMELYGFCSHCGKGRLTEDDILRLKPLLCPYCGAQMDEVNEWSK